MSKNKYKDILPSVKILVSYHKKDGLLKDDIITPINAGRANALASNKPDLPWLLEKTIGDNTGENISNKNSYYNEMTSLYWAWKNYDKLGNPDYIGHMHYRRHIFFKGGQKSVYELGDISSNYLSEIGYSPEKVRELCKNSDLIAPMPQWRASAYEHFKRNFDIRELDTAVSILKERNPELSEAADLYLADSKLYFCNIFIMPRELFFEYCSYIFPIMEEFENRIDMTEPGKRMYISEWLTGIFIRKQIDDGKRVTFLPTAVAEADFTIPVVFASDNNYAVQLGVAITSLFTNAKTTTHYDVRCLISDDFTDENKEKILTLLKKYPNHKITYVNVDDSVFDKVKIKTDHLTKGAFYRLLSADIFPELDKIIYLDVDLVVCDDLTTLFRYAIDTQYIGGIRAPGYYFPEKWRKDKESELGITIDQYINSGVLLMNLKKIRNENMQERFLELVCNNYRSEDQDTLNVACYNKIRHLPFRFNVQTKYIAPDSPERYKYESLIPEDERLDAEKHPVIIHFANKVKPWQDSKGVCSEKWWKYYDLFRCVIGEEYTALVLEPGTPKIVVPVSYGQELIESDCIVNLYEDCSEGIGEKERNWISKYCVNGTVGNSLYYKKEYKGLTAIYWIWKNYEKLGNPSSIGLCKSNLFLDMNLEHKSKMFIDGFDNAAEKMKLSTDELNKLCSEYSVIVSEPLVRETVYSHFAENHDHQLLDIAIDIINEIYPEYSQSAEKYVCGSQAFFNNTFIFSKKIFFEYAEWLFTILAEYCKRVEIKDEIHVRERLTGIFIQYQIDKGEKYCFLQSVAVEGKHIVPIVYAVDNSQINNACVSVASLIKNCNKTTNYDIKILVDDSFNNENRKKLTEIIKYENTHHDIKFISVGNKFYNSFTQNNKRIRSVYYKLLLPDLLSKNNRVIVLSPETIVMQDLTALYRTKTNIAINGVQSHICSELDSKAQAAYCRKVGLESMDTFIDTKVMLVEIMQLKPYDVKFLLKLSRNKNDHFDEDIISYVYSKSIGLLPEKFNVYTDFSDDALKNKPAVISYETGTNVSELLKDDSTRIWWKYAQCTPIILNAESLYNAKHGEMPYLADKTRSLSPKISVVIPVYNMEKYLVECLNSVVTQTLSDIEIICVNDGSDDNSLEILNDYASVDKRIIVINQSNVGVGNSRNIGIRIACGEYIAFMDPDDFYPDTTTLELLYTKAVKNNAEICGGSFCELDNNGKIQSNYRKELQEYIFSHEGFIKYEDHQFDYGYIRFIYKSSVIKENNLTFPPYSRFQDPPFFVNVMTIVGRFYAVTDFTYVYRLGYKTINWTSQKINDLMSGLIDNLIVSKQYELEKLHYRTYKHINSDNLKNIMANLMRGDKNLFAKLIRANELVDKTLIEKATNGRESFTTLKPLEELFGLTENGNSNNRDMFGENSYDKAVVSDLRNQLEAVKADNANLVNSIQLTRASLSYKIGRFFTYIPRKVRAFVKHTGS